MGLQGVELILCGYNTPIHYAPDPSQDILQGFHNALVHAGRRVPERHLGGRRGQGRRRGGRRLAGPVVHHRPERADRRPGAHDRRRADHGRLRPRLVPALHRHPVRLRPLPPPRALRPDQRTTRREQNRRADEPGRARNAGHDEHGLVHRQRRSRSRVRADHPHLLAALREELDITSPKDGCSPSGQCGCCTVLVDGKAIVSCQQPLTKVEGRSVVTLEGFDPDERARYADAFAACGGLQCGFCIPGIVVRAKAQVDKKGADLTREDMARHLGAHLCRCTGYVKVLDAIEAVAAGKELVPEQPGGIGTSGARYEAAALTLGDRGYVDDLRVPGLLHAALRLTDHARADIHRIDVEAARGRARRRRRLHRGGHPGRAAGRHHPHRLAGHDPRGRAHLLRRRRPRHRRGRDPAAGPRRGRPGRRDLRRAAAADRPRRRPRRPRARGLGHRLQHPLGVRVPPGRRRRPRWPPAPTWSTRSSRPSASSTRSSSRRRPWPSPTPTPGRCTCTRAARACGTTATRSRPSSTSTASRITVELVSNGGAFGGKEDMANQAHAALAAWLLQRPVKCVLSREESLLHARQAPPDPRWPTGSGATPTAA